MSEQPKELFFFNTDLAVEQESDKPTRLVGYAMKFNTLSHDRGGYRDVFRLGVFGETLGSNEWDVKAYYDHNERACLARMNNGTLRLAVDEMGLRFSIDIPDTTLGRDVSAMIQSGDISGMSFGYVPTDYRWKEEPNGTPIREHVPVAIGLESFQ